MKDRGQEKQCKALWALTAHNAGLNLGSTTSSCVTLDRLGSHSEPLFPQWQNQGDKIYLGVLSGDEKT